MSPTEIKASEAARQIGHLFDRASRGEAFTVTRYGRPLAVMGPPSDAGTSDAVARAKENLTRYRGLDPEATQRDVEIAAAAVAASLESLLLILDPEAADGP